jgi:hypothetical protein
VFCDRIQPKDQKAIKRVDPFMGSKQANESFHAVKGEYANERLNFMTSTEARFSLAVTS